MNADAPIRATALSRRFALTILQGLRAAAIACGLFAGGYPAAAQKSEAGKSGPRAAVSVGHTQNILAIASSPDGKQLFTTDSQQICVWDVDTGKEVRVIGRRQGTPDNISSIGVGIANSHDWVLVTDDSGLTVYRAKDLAPIKRIPARGSAAFAWDTERGLGYFGGAHSYMVEPDRDDVLKLTQRFIRAPEGTPAPQGAQSVFVLPGNRLFLDCHPGYAVVDASTWQTLLTDTTDWRDFQPAGGDHVVAKKSVPFERSYNTELELIRVSDMAVLAKKSFKGISHVFGTEAQGGATDGLWVCAEGKLRSLNVHTLEEQRSIDIPAQLGTAENAVVHLASVPNSTLHALSVNSRVGLVNLRDGKMIRLLGDNAFSAQRIAASPEGSEIFATDLKGTVKRIRFLPTGLAVLDTAMPVRSFAYDPLGEEIAFASYAGAVVTIATRADFPKPDLEIRGKNSKAGATDMVFSADGNIVAISDGYGITAVSRQDGSTLVSDVIDVEYDRKGRMALSPDGKWLVTYGPLNRISGFNLQEKRKAWETRVEGPRETFAFIGPDSFACLQRGMIEYRSAENGGLIFDTPIETANWGLRFVGAVSPDQTHIAIYDGTELLVVDAETGETRLKQPAPPLRDLAFLAGSKYVAAAGEDNLLRLWNVELKKEICSLATFIGNADWVACAPDSRFDASDDAIDKLYLVDGVNVRPLESMFEQLYTPHLLSNVLAGKVFDTLPVNVSDLKPQPMVSLSLAEGSRNLQVEDDQEAMVVQSSTVVVKIKASAPSSTVAEVRLYHNGKLITTVPASASSLETTIETALEPGENVLRAVALNVQRTESKPVDLPLRLKLKPETLNAAPAAGLQLHLVAIGVNQYQNPQYNLNYAEADAKAVREQLEARTKGIFSKVTVHHIVNQDAQKSALVAALKSVSAKAGKRDVFVFYFAGHGVMTTEGKPEFFLVPHDVTQLYGADDALRAKGLSSAELMELSKLIPAQKQLFVLDACQSAGALKDVAMRGAAEEKAIAQLARSTGTHWLTASGSEQFATEFEQLGHGAFTYVLLDALSGKADTGDGRVTVNELKAYLESQVPEVTQKHKGSPQFPSSYGFGQDFPIAIVK